MVELRIPGTKRGTASGYFDDFEALAGEAASYNGRAQGIYVTLNPVNPALLSRAENRVQERAKQTTSDADVTHRVWLLVDLDPVRPSGISASEAERAAALEMAEKIRADLSDEGWPEPVVADSGNGTHLLYRINLPNDGESTNLVKAALQALDLRYSDDRVQVDSSTHSAGQLLKLYGTMSCKGDDTEERPHRVSAILQCPEEITEVTAEQLRELASGLPQTPQRRKGKKAGGENLDVESWLAEHGLEVAFKGRWQNKGTKYVLETCPWNESHTNRSAYVIQFDGGGVAAGCLHNSCRNENWGTLRDKIEPGVRLIDEAATNKENQVDTLIRLGSEAEFFHDEIEEAYAAVEIDGHVEVLKIKHSKFKMWLLKRFYDELGTAPGTDALNQALGVMQMRALFDGEECALQLRVAEHEGAFYYDLADSEWRAVRVTPDGCQVLELPPILFVRNKNTKAQMEPDFDGDVTLLLKHVNLKRSGALQEGEMSDDQLLCLVYVVSCLVPGIPHPVLDLCGEKGAAKTTAQRMIRAIVDPAVRDILTLPKGIQDLALVLANNYMPAFDNLDTISPEKSDMLCTAVTGGGFSKRTLYTDDDETILTFKRCVVLNGINVVATRADLLDRSIILELERMDEESRKEERQVWADFEADRPKIVGGALTALSKAMSIYPGVQLDRLGRMADFSRWGYAIAEALGLGGERFIDAYLRNQERANEEAVTAHPVAAALVVLMASRRRWHGTVAELLANLAEIADREGISIRNRLWPGAPNVLSRRMKEMRSNLLQLGIEFDIRNSGPAKEVTIVRASAGDLSSGGAPSVLKFRQRPQPVHRPSNPMKEIGLGD